MKLITPELAARFSEVKDQSEIKNPLVIAKFFNPAGAGTWYATEYDPETNICFGYVTNLVPDALGMFDEWGSFSVDELESLELPFGLRIERDIHFEEIRFNELFKEKRLSELSLLTTPKPQDQELEF